jgi:hypothetical protein
MDNFRNSIFCEIYFDIFVQGIIAFHELFFSFGRIK